MSCLKADCPTLPYMGHRNNVIIALHDLYVNISLSGKKEHNVFVQKKQNKLDEIPASVGGKQNYWRLLNGKRELTCVISL
ncbi:hypothetical protein AHF37_01704 [Paragonimus kellicotti]|nr:hypothetical protein AHF37_01704 [Paragonimus kellicotti]